MLFSFFRLFVKPYSLKKQHCCLRQLDYYTKPFRLCQELFQTFFILPIRFRVAERSEACQFSATACLYYHPFPFLSIPIFVFFEIHSALASMRTAAVSSAGKLSGILSDIQGDHMECRAAQKKENPHTVTRFACAYEGFTGLFGFSRKSASD